MFAHNLKSHSQKQKKPQLPNKGFKVSRFLFLKSNSFMLKTLLKEPQNIFKAN